MILKSLEDLEKYKSKMSTAKNVVSLKDINEVSEGGGESTNSYNNKLFYWNFDPYYIKELVSYYEELAQRELNQKNINQFKNRVIDISNEMMKNNTCPIEAILYSSKSVNYLLENNLMIDILGDIISKIYLKRPDEYRDTIKFILNEWSWNLQIIALINACGKIGDMELINIIYTTHTKDDTRLEALKAFMNINNNICIEYTLNLISQIKESDNIEVQMVKYFINNYIKSFGKEAVKKAEQYLVDESINKQAKKAISRIMPNVSKVESVTLNTMIKRAKNWDREENFEEMFKEWMKDSSTRKNAFLAIRYSNSKNVESMIMEVLNNYNCNSVEIGTAIITLAQWGTRKGISENFYKLIEKYKGDLTKKIYCNAAMCSIGDEKNSLELIEEFLEQRHYDSRQIFSIIRDCAYKSSALIKNSIKKVYVEYLYSKDEKNIIKAINRSYELCDNPKFNFKDIVLPEIKKAVGINGSRIVKYSEDVYIALINLVERLLNDKNKDEFIDILFFMIENEFCSKKIKCKSIMMLKRLKVDPPR